MIYAAVLFCSMNACAGYPDTASPYDTEADCRAAHEQRRAMMQLVAQRMGARTFREICAPIEDVRRLIPGAFPGVPEGVLL